MATNALDLTQSTFTLLLMVGVAIGALIILAALLRWILGISTLIATQEVIAKELIRCRTSLEAAEQTGRQQLRELVQQRLLLEELARLSGADLPPAPQESHAMPPAPPVQPAAPPARRFPFQA